MPLRVIDFFCGAGGMTFGLRRAGLRVIAGVDIDPTCKETYEKNNAGVNFVEADIAQLRSAALAKTASIRARDDDLVFVGCSPCQFWSKINTDRTQNQKTAYLLREFQRFVEELLPGYVVIENVPGLLRKKDHSALPEFLAMLDLNGYRYAGDVVNAIRYAVPQNRKRYLLIASRACKRVTLPAGRRNCTLVVRKFIGVHNGFRRVSAGHMDCTRRLHTAAGLSVNNLRRIRRTRHDGGDRLAWKDDCELQIPAYAGDDQIFRDVYGRMAWDHAAPTITTRFTSFSNGRFGHPEEDRAITLREGATLQTFPRSYHFFATNHATIARHIGNAVPPALAERVGRHLLKLRHDG
jgi:DNA (cytosine-5)-methyltransferase 1